jgi:hypothetical protein
MLQSIVADAPELMGKDLSGERLFKVGCWWVGERLFKGRAGLKIPPKVGTSGTLIPLVPTPVL